MSGCNKNTLAIDFKAFALKQRQNLFREGDPILFNWTRHKIQKALAEAEAEGNPKLNKIDVEVKALIADLERKAKLIEKYPEWAQIWGVEIRREFAISNDSVIYGQRNGHFIPYAVPKPYYQVILESLFECDWLVRKGFSFSIVDDIWVKHSYYINYRYNKHTAGDEYIIQDLKIESYVNSYQMVEITCIGGHEFSFLPDKRILETLIKHKESWTPVPKKFLDENAIRPETWGG